MQPQATPSILCNICGLWNQNNKLNNGMNQWYECICDFLSRFRWFDYYNSLTTIFRLHRKRFVAFYLFSCSYTLVCCVLFFWLNVWCVVYIVIIFQQAKVFRFDLPFNLAVVTYTFCVWLKMVFDSETST